jgi:threonine dehydratase
VRSLRFTQRPHEDGSTTLTGPGEIKVSLNDVRAARELLSRFVTHTPIVRSEAIDAAAGRWVGLKCENLQHTGSFKVRGALNALLQMSADDLKRGVVTESSGNFGIGVAWASKRLGVRAAIVMPHDATVVKRDTATALGATVHLCAPTLIERERVVAEIGRATGATYVSSHDDLRVIAGQGTVALEVIEQMPTPESVLVPVGGGGLISGVAIVLKTVWPKVRVIGVQPVGAADAARSKAAGRRVTEAAPHSIARGLLVNLGLENWLIINELVDDIVVVDDAEIIEAMRLVWEGAKLVVEPSAAVTVAALLSPGLRERLGIGTAIAILSGGNVDLDCLPWKQAQPLAVNQPEYEEMV